jgi:hypothetical protein
LFDLGTGNDIDIEIGDNLSISASNGVVILTTRFFGCDLRTTSLLFAKTKNSPRPLEDSLGELVSFPFCKCPALTAH